MACPICLKEASDEASDEDEDTWITTPCGHRMHTQCALKNAWAGNIGCPICRTIPGQIDRSVVEDAIFEAREEHNDKEMHKYYLKGMRDFRTKKNTSVRLKIAITSYNKYKDMMKKKREIKKIQNKVLVLMRKYMKAAFQKKKNKLEASHGKMSVTKLRMRVYSNKEKGSKFKDRYFKKKIASAAGWVPIDD